MDLKTKTSPIFLKKELRVKKRLEKVLSHQDLDQQKDLLKRILSESDLECLDYAAALLYLSQPNLYHQPKNIVENERKEIKKIATTPTKPLLIKTPKMIRYRVDVGEKHQTTIDEIKNVFVAEAGVDKNMIGEVDMRHHYTLIELPEGMPADIFQLLTTVNIKQQPLNIKRLKKRRFHKTSRETK